jgi:ribosomal protein S18 acetylase RimI-like enzyme
MQIRAFEEKDWPQLWPIIREIVRAADTFVYDPAMSEAEARAIWTDKPPLHTVVAEEAGIILGSAKIGPNRAGPGAHISTASFMVSSKARGKGVGGALCRFALDWAKAQGYAGMQFNAVAESNVHAIDLYKRLGFSIVGTIPGGFEHPALGRIGLHIMYCPF